MSLAEWVRVGRIHTAALTMPITLLGYVLAGGRDVFTGLLWLLFGLWWHYVGFLQNNIFDYRYDKVDPAKQHFPLVRGSIKLRSAVIVDTVGLALLFIWGALMGTTASLVFLVVGVVSGTTYNAISKVTLLKPIPISLCFASLPLISYTSLRPVDDVGLLLFASVFTTIFYQIGFSGELKDIERAEVNILRYLGFSVPYYATLLKVINIASILALMFRLQGSFEMTYHYVAVVIITSLIAVLFVSQIRDWTLFLVGLWDREKALKKMSLMEILTYYLLVAAVTPVIGYWAVAWYTLPLIWFILMNRIIFGTSIYPRV